MIDRASPLLLLGISYAGLAVAAGAGSIWGFVLAALVTAATEVGLVRRWTRVERTLAKLSFDVVVRSLVVDVLVIVLAVQAIGVRGYVRATVIAGTVLIVLAIGGYLLLRRLDADQPAVAWRNLSVAQPRWWRSRYQGARLLGDHVGLPGWLGPASSSPPGGGRRIARPGGHQAGCAPRRRGIDRRRRRPSRGTAGGVDGVRP